MKLNGIACGGFTMPLKDTVEFSLTDTTIEAVGALDGQDLILTEDDGETVVGSFKGYTVTAVYQSNGSIRMRAARALDADSKAAIEALETNMELLSAKAASIEQSVTAVESTNSEVMQAMGELGTTVDQLNKNDSDIMEAIGELGTMIAMSSAPTE